MQGDFPIVTDVIRDNTNPNYGKKVYADVSDPIDTKFECRFQAQDVWANEFIYGLYIC